MSEPREIERERERFIRNNLHNGVVSGAARGQALLGPMWAGLTPDSKGDPTGDTGEPDRRRQETPHLSARRKGALPASPGGPPSTGQKKLRVLNPILRLYRIQPTGKSFRVIEMCDVRSGHAPRPHTQTASPVSATRVSHKNRSRRWRSPVAP